MFLYDKIRCRFRKNPFIGKRFAYGVGDGKEKAEQTAVPDVEKVEQRKAQARGEIDAIYGGKYDTYNFRKLPQEFKDRMKSNFGEWIDANIAKYDKDKNSGINAAEYAEFKAQLNEKVSEILDRLIEVKEKKKKEAEKTKETAEQAQEAQKRLEGINTDKLNEANLENEDGCYTELLSYQKDFEKEAGGFTALAGVFSGAKEQAENANKSHYTGITAVGEYLVKVGSDILPWVDDIPEVKSAEQAKEKAIADFRSKLAEMKTRQKERQGRGSKLNGAPGKIRGKVTTQYGEAKNKTREDLDKAKNAAEANLREKARLAEEIKSNDVRKKSAQKEYDILAIRLRQAEQRMAEVKKRTGEMKEAAAGFESLAGQAQQEKAKRAPEPEIDRGLKSTPGKLSPDELAKQSSLSAHKAREASGQLEVGLAEADKAVGGMSGSAMAMQKRLADLNTGHNKMSSDYSKREKTGDLLEKAKTDLSDRMGKLDTEEKQRMEQVDSLDSAIAETVIQVDTSNFELIKKGEEYLKMLTSLDIAGPGLFDTAGAMFKGIPGVESAYNWGGDKLSNGWKLIKGVPVLGDAIEIVGYMGEGWTKAWDGIGDGLSWVGDKLHLQDAWDWMGKASKHLEGWKPIKSEFWGWFNTVLDYGGGMVGTVVEVFAGVTESAKDLVKGIGMILRNPLDLIKGLGGMLNHPGMILNALIQKDKWGDESVSKLIGRGLFDIITTCTGAGATATAVKTSLAALQIGKLTFGKAILLGIETFGRTFIKDISAILKGVIMFTPNVIKGGANLIGRLAGGGKKAEAVAGEMSRAAKMAKEAEEAYKAVEAVRGKPDEFIKLVRKNPHIMDLHGQHLKNLQREEDTAAKAKKEASRLKEQELAAPTVTINDQVIKAGDRVQSPFKEGETAYVRWSKGKYYLAREPLGVPFDTMTAFQLPTKKRLSAAAKRQSVEAAALARTAEAQKLADAQKMAEVAPLVKELEDAARQAHSANEAHIREALGAALAKANHKGPFDMDQAVKQVRESVGRKVDKAVEEAKASKDAKAISRATKEIDELVRTTTERHINNYLDRHGITVPEGAVAAKRTAHEKEPQATTNVGNVIPDEGTTPLGIAGRKRADVKQRKHAARAEIAPEKHEVAQKALTPAEKELLARNPNFSIKPLTPERLFEMSNLEEIMKESRVLESIKNKWKENLKELKKKHGEEIAGIEPGSDEYRRIARRQQQEAGKFDTHHLLQALPQDELEMLRRNFNDLDETMMERVLQQQYSIVLDTKKRPVRVYMGNPINHGTFGMVGDVAYVVGTEKKIRKGAIKRPRDAASLRADDNYKNITGKEMKELETSIEVNFYNEGRTFKAVGEFSDRKGLLEPRVVSFNPDNRFIIYDKIDAGPGEGVRLKDRITSGDKSEDILGYAVDAMDGEFNLASNGWFHLDIKPENIFVGRNKSGGLQGVLGDLSLNNVDDVSTIRVVEGTVGQNTRYGVLKINVTDFSRSLQLGVTPDFFSPAHVNKSFNWVKAPENIGKLPPMHIMALAGNNAFAVTLERIFYDIVRDKNGNIISISFDEGRLPVANGQKIRGEIESLVKRLKDPDSGIDITTRQAEFRRIQKMMAEARAQDGRIVRTALRPTG